MPNQDLGKMVRERRLALGYSLGQLANKVNRTASSIRAWERGDDQPSSEEAVDLAAALDLDESALLQLISAEDPWEEPDSDDGAAPVDDPWDGVATGDSVSVLDVAAAVDAADVAEHDVESTVSDAADEFESAAVIPAVPSPPVASDSEAEAPLEVDSASTNEVEMPEPLPGKNGDAADFSDLIDAPTEAVPVVVPAAVAVQTAEPEVVVATADIDTVDQNPLVAGWNQVVGMYRRFFDPHRPWIYRLRMVLLVIAFYFMFRLLRVYLGELWDAIGDVLDSFSFGNSETPDLGG